MKVKEAFMLAQELVESMETGEIDMDDAIEMMADAYPALEYEHITAILNDVLEMM
jgi:exonuclease VII small subunit